MVRIDYRRLLLTVSAVLAIFGLNVWVLYYGPARESIKSSPTLPLFRATREFVLSPGCLALIAALIFLSLRWALTLHKRPVSEFERLGGIAVALATILGLLITYVYNP